MSVYVASSSNFSHFVNTDAGRCMLCGCVAVQYRSTETDRNRNLQPSFAHDTVGSTFRLRLTTHSCRPDRTIRRTMCLCGSLRLYVLVAHSRVIVV